MELSPGWVSAGAAVLGVVLTGVGAWINDKIQALKVTQKLLFDKHDGVIKDLADYKLRVAETYVNREMLREQLNPISEQLKEIREDLKNLKQ